MTESKGYSPLGADAQAHVNEAWKSYREVFGLEGQKVFEMRQANVDENVIAKTVEENRALRKEILPLWEEVWITE